MTSSDTGMGQLIKCPQCGEYELIGPYIFDKSRDWKFKPALSCAARQASEARQRLKITADNASAVAAAHEGTRFAHNVDKLLALMADRSARPGKQVTFPLDLDFTLIDCYSSSEFKEYIDWAIDEGFAEGTLTAEGYRVRLTMSGWNRVQPLPQPGGIPGRCFVAMWFSEETRDAYENGIEPAVKDAGFLPIRIDRKEHNNEIPDEIIAEIRNAQFVVADFTGQRAGVYYEAGFSNGPWP